MVACSGYLLRSCVHEWVARYTLYATCSLHAGVCLHSNYQLICKNLDNCSELLLTLALSHFPVCSFLNSKLLIFQDP